jgi:hypothetical protein
MERGVSTRTTGLGQTSPWLILLRHIFFGACMLRRCCRNDDVVAEF